MDNQQTVDTFRKKVELWRDVYRLVRFMNFTPEFKHDVRIYSKIVEIRSPSTYFGVIIKQSFVYVINSKGTFHFLDCKLLGQPCQDLEVTPATWTCAWLLEIRK